VFAINTAASILGATGASTGALIRDSGESPAHYARRMRELERTVCELLAAALQERKVKRDAGRVNTILKVLGDRVLLRTK
jgi:hypothetical protein